MILDWVFRRQVQRVNDAIDPPKFPEDRACVECKHFRADKRRLLLRFLTFGWDRGWAYHARCAHPKSQSKEIEDLSVTRHMILGKRRVVLIEMPSCHYQRTHDNPWCGVNGLLWERR